jgi:hypothetical protein
LGGSVSVEEARLGLHCKRHKCVSAKQRSAGTVPARPKAADVAVMGALKNCVGETAITRYLWNRKLSRAARFGLWTGDNHENRSLTGWSGTPATWLGSTLPSGMQNVRGSVLATVTRKSLPPRPQGGHDAGPEF